VDARLAKNMPGRNARFAGKDLQCQSANAGQSPSVASRAFGEASSDCVGQMRSRANASRDDRRGAHHCRLYGMTAPSRINRQGSTVLRQERKSRI